MDFEECVRIKKGDFSVATLTWNDHLTDPSKDTQRLTRVERTDGEWVSFSESPERRLWYTDRDGIFPGSSHPGNFKVRNQESSGSETNGWQTVEFKGYSSLKDVLAETGEKTVPCTVTRKLSDRKPLTRLKKCSFKVTTGSFDLAGCLLDVKIVDYGGDNQFAYAESSMLTVAVGLNVSHDENGHVKYGLLSTVKTIELNK